MLVPLPPLSGRTTIGETFYAAPLHRPNNGYRSIFGLSNKTASSLWIIVILLQAVDLILISLCNCNRSDNEATLYKQTKKVPLIYP